MIVLVSMLLIKIQILSTGVNSLIIICLLVIWLIWLGDIVVINELAKILKIIGQCDVKYIMTVSIKTNISILNAKKGALDLQPQVIKYTSCLPMIGGSLWERRLLPPLKVVAMI